MNSTREQLQFKKKGKMTVDSHFWRSDEEYEQEKVEITIHLELLTELLQENVRNQTHGWTMRNKVKWQKLHSKKEKQVNIRLMEELKKLEQMLSCE